ncbi:MAG: hypothetical protein DWI24_04725 [Planctomycetota bacterium]|nr:MAG: hypothetical protein DWI24_04725 [Planctomycetota bacterium]
MTHSNSSDQATIWNRAEDDSNRRRARVFEREWHESKGSYGVRRPRIEDYLPKDVSERLPALLALARVDMACRIDVGEPAQVEDYCQVLSGCSESPFFIAGLAFEEYMLRMEAGGKPRLAEYAKRFPLAYESLRELVLIQEAVAGEALEDEAKRMDGFPEVGQNLEGFELVGELGVGSYAKVYLAHDALLAGREVALKVTRGQHDEWLTLARLQHTHIVPIYSHKKTQTGGHHFDLVCMPYFGRVTLNTVIEHADWDRCLSGRDMMNLIDSLQPEVMVDEARESSARRSLSELSFAQAVAWWGASLADALRHAHERRVLHRDIKPTNILVTPECEPMLLDFNLAMQSPVANLPDKSSHNSPVSNEEGIGGTLAYMAPEHLEAMMTGRSRLVDQRADIYSLGAVLYEALTRSRMANKSYVPADSREELLRQNLELRKLPAKSVRDVAPDVPIVLDRVIRKCLDPDPSRRYSTAAQLSEDLRAIAADLPIRHAQEPITSRLGRSLRRNRMVLISAISVSAILLIGPGYSMYQSNQQERLNRLTRESFEDLKTANLSKIREDYTGALNSQRRVLGRLADENQLSAIYDLAERDLAQTKRMEQARRSADQYISEIGWLRYRILHATRFGGELDIDDLESDLERIVFPILKQFSLPVQETNSEPVEKWVDDLHELQQIKLKDWTELVLFEAVCAMNNPSRDNALRFGLSVCLEVTNLRESSLPWTVLRERLSASLERVHPPSTNWTEPRHEVSAVACFQYSRLSQLDGRHDKASQWLRRAIAIDPSDPWGYHELALLMQYQGQFILSLDRFDIATALDRKSPWARLDRARLERIQGQYVQAEEDLKTLEEQFRADSIGEQVKPLLTLETGLVEQGMGRFEQSEKLLINLLKETKTNHSLRLLAAQAWSEQLVSEGRWPELQVLLDEFDPNHNSESTWSLIRARLLIGQNRSDVGIQALNHFLKSNPDVLTARSMRAQAFLKTGQSWEALEDAQKIVRRSNMPMHFRLLNRSRISVLAELPTEDSRWFQTLVSLRLDDPEIVLIWPQFDRRQIEKVIQRLRRLADDPRMTDTHIGNLRNRCRLNLAVLESALGIASWQESLNQSLENDDISVQSVRAQVLVMIYQNQFETALERLEDGLKISFEDPMLIDLRGRLYLAKGEYANALQDFDNILSTRELSDVRAWRAKTLERLSRLNESLADFSKALASDPFQPDWRMLRARIWQRLGRNDLALADLELITSVCSENAFLNSRLALAKAIIASAPKARSENSSKFFQRAARSAWPDLFPRPNMEDLNLKTDLKVEQTGATRK